MDEREGSVPEQNYPVPRISAEPKLDKSTPELEPRVLLMFWPSFTEERLYALLVTRQTRRQFVACLGRSRR
jgi:hypothetical protein